MQAVSRAQGVSPLPLDTSLKDTRSSSSHSNPAIPEVASSAITPPLTSPPAPPRLSNLTPRSERGESEENSSGSEGSNIKPPKPQKAKFQLTAFTLHGLMKSYNEAHKLELSQTEKNSIASLGRLVNQYKSKAINQDQLFDALNELESKKELKNILPKVCELLGKLDDAQEIYKHFLTRTFAETQMNTPLREESPGTSLFVYLLKQEFITLFKESQGYPFAEMAAQTIIAMAVNYVFVADGPLKLTQEKEKELAPLAAGLTYDFICRIAWDFDSKSALLTESTKNLCAHFLTLCKQAPFTMSKEGRHTLSFDKVFLVNIIVLRCFNVELTEVRRVLGEAKNEHYKKFAPIFTLLLKNFQKTINTLLDSTAPLDDNLRKISNTFSFIVNCLIQKPGQVKSSKTKPLQPPSTASQSPVSKPESSLSSLVSTLSFGKRKA